MPYAVKCNGTYYYYITNLQGDVLRLIDASGNTVASYTYDPYGNILSATGTMAETNPLRYRGYYYDTETGLYYLQSRYYDPTTGRFISADSFVCADQNILGNNTFAYCSNNPISRIDETGHWFFDVFWDVASLVVSVIEVIQDPTDVGAWVGLALDFVDVVIPVVGGLGEIADAANVARKATDTFDDIHDASKVTDNFDEFTNVIIDEYEIKCPQQIKMSEATDAWDDFLGPNQTNYNKFTGEIDPDRIFSADGNRSIRLTGHEMNSFGKTTAHFHYEEWLYNADTNTVLIFNQLQRLK